ncbi:class I SAM-dependent methyltransferase [Altererythrobacter fulvus]|uniref:class I SAM-dependent methyltransferase n=1 Tax=Caenibius fulvus TaxID=2126012 RepID=UPI0030192DCA
MDPQTAEFYRTRSREWAAALPRELRPELDAFLDRLAPGARILELGCGDGRDAQRMIERGFDVDTSDGVPEMAQLASERIGRPVPVMLYEELEAEGEYDAAWCHASLLHVPLADLPGILARIHRALKPSAPFYANYKGGEGGHHQTNGRDDFGRFYSYLSVADLEAAYRKAVDWADLGFVTTQGGSFGGTPTIWHAVTARK